MDNRKKTSLNKKALPEDLDKELKKFSKEYRAIIALREIAELEEIASSNEREYYSPIYRYFT